MSVHSAEAVLLRKSYCFVQTVIMFGGKLNQAVQGGRRIVFLVGDDDGP